MLTSYNFQQSNKAERKAFFQQKAILRHNLNIYLFLLLEIQKMA